eukprot:scaffold40425_cov150-Skeletonema_dohrnii-CCMP3373.AAC.2
MALMHTAVWSSCGAEQPTEKGSFGVIMWHSCRSAGTITGIQTTTLPPPLWKSVGLLINFIQWRSVDIIPPYYPA